jgi:trehalose monomycolate/heme transporter
MLSRFGGFLYTARIAVVIVSLLAVGGAAAYGFGVFGTLKSAGFTVPTSQSARAQDFVDAHLGASTSDLVILLHSDTLSVTDPAFQQAATGMLNTLAHRQEVAGVTSYYGTHSANFLSTDGHSTFALVHLATTGNQTKDQAYDAVAPLMTAPPLQVTLGGALLVNRQLSQQIGKDIERAEIITMPIVLLLLVVVFGSVLAALLPLIICGVAIVGAFALLRGLTTITDVSIFAINVITMLGLGLAIDYALFIVTRFREELGADPADVQGAVRRTMATAGRTVLFSGLTVSTSLLSLLLFPEYFLRSMGLGAIAAVLVAMLGALTLLPAILSLLGPRVNAMAVRRQRLAPVTNDAHGAWYRLSQGVMRRPIPVALAVVALLLVLGSPFLRASFGTVDVHVLPTDHSARVTADRMASDFPQQSGAQITIALQTPGDALAADNLAALQTYVQQLKSLPGVSSVQSLVTVDPHLTLAQYQYLYAHPGANAGLDATAGRMANGDATLVTATLTSADHTTDAVNAVKAIRALAVPAGFAALVGGVTPSQMDLFANLVATIPLALLVIAGAIFVLLFLMTGSVVMPIKAIVLNTLSLSATFGALVFIFQEGHFANLLRFETLGTLDSTQPVLIFAIAFGLSMDYEVFLLSRIKERYDATGDNRLAVASGLQRTGGLITSAALLLAVVLLAFATSEIVFIKMIGVGLAIAVIMDATLVRALLVPATMRLLGRANWWSPAPLRWLWQRVGLSDTERAPVAAAIPATVASEE